MRRGLQKPTSLLRREPSGELRPEGPHRRAIPRFINVLAGRWRIEASGLRRRGRGARETAVAMAALLGFGLLWAGVESVEKGPGPLRGKDRTEVTTFAVTPAWSRAGLALSWDHHAQASPRAVGLRRNLLAGERR